MPICEGCAGSYANEYSFCPYCGRAKPSPQRLEVEIQAKPRRIEQATMRINLQAKIVLEEYPFNWRKGIGWILGNAILGGGETVDKNWNEVGVYTLQLIAYHPERGEYVAFTSPSFMAFLEDLDGYPRNLPIFVVNTLRTGRPTPWLTGFFDQRRIAWKAFNNFLLEHNWAGLSKEAITREPPFKIDRPMTYEDTKGNLIERQKQMDADPIGLSGLWFTESDPRSTREIKFITPEKIGLKYTYHREV